MIKLKYLFKLHCKKENRKRVEELIIRFALNAARSENKEEKQMAIMQLANFTDDIAFNGLIKLLSDEKDTALKCLIINILSNIIKRK